MGQKCNYYFETLADYGLADKPLNKDEPLPKLHAAIKKVQQTHSHYGITSLDYITMLLEESLKNGSSIRIYGWYADSTEDDNFFNVWLFLNENEELCEFHWVIDLYGFINPVSELAQGVMARQKACDL